MKTKLYWSIAVRKPFSESSASWVDVSEQLTNLPLEGNWLDSLKPFQVNWHLLWFM